MRAVFKVTRKTFSFMERYSAIEQKQKREIVLLRGRGCAYKKCAFCDYYLDSSPNDDENFEVNREALSRVMGVYGDLEVINSGSVFELDSRTLDLIKSICKQKNISTLHFEAHYMYARKIPLLRKFFDGIDIKVKLGLETFDFDFRENFLHKGIPDSDPATIAEFFDEANLLFGITGQSAESMLYDMKTGLKYFERLCVNIMCENTRDIKPDKAVTELFMREIYPKYIDDRRVDILVNNTDFGVGE